MNAKDQSTKFLSVFENAIDGIILIDNRGTIEEINEAALKTFKYSKEEVIGQNVKMLMPEPHHGEHDGYIHNYVTTKKPKIIGVGREVEGLKKDGSTFPFRLAVSEVKLEDRVLFTGIIHDLSEERKAQEELKRHTDNLENTVKERTKLLEQANLKLEAEISREEDARRNMVESQKLYKAIAENFPNGTISVLDQNFCFLFIEGQGLRDVGYGTTELIGKNYLDVLVPEIRDVVYQKLSAVFEGIPATFEMEIKQSMFRVRAVPLEGETNKTNRILLVESNITKQKNAEREIYNSLQKEKELNEMKSRFVSMASHEFRTPLSTILSSSSLIEKYAEINEPQKVVKHTSRIKNNVRNLTMILNDFLSLEKLENRGVNTVIEEFDIVECIQEIKEDMDLLKRPNQSLVLEQKLDNPVVKTDRFVIQNIMTNLVTNAIKYSTDDDTIRIVISKTGPELLIEVIDHGIGISEEDQQHLFNRFYRASNAGNVQGTGLGLHIVKRYIALLNGELHFQSTLNEGSTFGIRVKLNDAL